MSLNGWDITKRKPFIIKSSVIDEGVGTLPFLFKIFYETGIDKVGTIDILNNLAQDGDSDVNKHKIAVSQLIDGAEQQCYCEISAWDHSNLYANIWVKPKELSSIEDNFFYIYYDKNHVDNDRYVSTTSGTSTELFMDLAQEGTYDANGVLPFEVLKVDNKYQMWYIGYTTSWYIMHCESDDFTTWSGHQLVVDHTHTYDTDNQHPGTVIYASGTYKMWYSGYDGTNWRIMYCTSTDGKTWSNHQVVVDYNEHSYASTYAYLPCVLKEGAMYKMWYSGYDGTNYRIIYCNSTDGLSWSNHQMVIDYTTTPEIGTDRVRPNKIVYVDDMYRLWLDYYNGTTWVTGYTTSINGIQWSDVRRSIYLDVLGTYDTSGTLFSTVYEEDDYYHFFYGGSNGSNWRILYAKSVSLSSPRTPSQEVWSDFNSVHHLNTDYGYIDSTSSRLDATVNNVTSTTLSGVNALLYDKQDSYVKIPHNAAFDDNGTFGATIFSKIDSGNVLYSKGTKAKVYYSRTTNISPSDNFTGTNDDPPEVNRWSISDANGSITIDNNRLKLISNDTSGDWKAVNAYSRFDLAGDFDIEFEYIGPWETDADHYTMLGVLESDWRMYIGPRWYGGMYFHLQTQEPGGGNIHESTATAWTDGGFVRITRVGTVGKLYYKHYLSDSWILRKTITVGTDNATARLHHQKRYASETSFTAYLDNFTVTSGTPIWSYPAVESAVITCEITDISTTHTMEHPAADKVDAYTITHFGKDAFAGANTPFYLNTLTTAVTTETLVTNTTDVYIGATAYSVNGFVVAVLFSDSVFTPAELNYLNLAFTDNLILIPTYYIQGYTTHYNTPITTTVLAYDTATGDLIGVTQSDPYDGYYRMDVMSGNECFVIGIDGVFYNHMIVGKVIPD